MIRGQAAAGAPKVRDRAMMQAAQRNLTASSFGKTPTGARSPFAQFKRPGWAGISALKQIGSKWLAWLQARM